MTKEKIKEDKWLFWRTQKNDMPPWGAIARRWGNTTNPEFFKLMNLYIDSLIIWQKGQVWSYFGKKDLKKFDKIFLDRIIKKSDFLKSIRNHHFERLKKVLAQSLKINRLNLKKKTNRELYELFKEFKTKYNSAVVYTILAMFFQFGLEKYTRDYIKKQAKKYGDELKINDYFSVLTRFSGESWSLKEEKALYRIAITISKHKKEKEIFKKYPPRKINRKLKANPILFNLVDQHYKSYRWLPYKYYGPAWNKIFFLRRLKNMLEDLNQAKIKFKTDSTQILNKKRQHVIEELHIDKKHQTIFSTIVELIYLKEYRNGIWCRIQFELSPFIKELQSRFKLTFLQIHYMTFAEWETMLKEEKISKKFIKELNQRYIFSVWFGGKGQEKFLAGKLARQMVKKEIGSIVVKPLENISCLRGNVAQPGGIITGRARIILNSRDIFKVSKNDILIAPMTNQDYFVGMQKAKAVVTDAGGIVSHAAILARELKIPCIVGTQNATQIFKNNDLIEVDTNNGMIKKLNQTP